MENLLTLLDSFEKRNNTSVTLYLHSDGSGSLNEFWDDEIIKCFETSTVLLYFLTNGKLEMKDGRSVSPIKIIHE